MGGIFAIFHPPILIKYEKTLTKIKVNWWKILHVFGKSGGGYVIVDMRVLNRPRKYLPITQFHRYTVIFIPKIYNWEKNKP